MALSFAPERPRSVPETFDRAFGLYRLNARSLLTISGLVLFPAGLVVGLGQVAYQVILAGVAQSGGASDPQGLTTLLLAVSFMLALTGVYALANMVARGALVAAALHLYSGRSMSAREAYRYLGSRAIGYLATDYLVGLAVGVGTLFFLVPGIVAGVLWSLAATAVLAEERSPFDAMGRSYALVRRHFWRVFGALSGMVLLVMALQSIVTTPAQLVNVAGLLRDPEAFFRPSTSILAVGLQGLLSAVAAVVVAPVSALIVAGIFVDLRLRWEGEDLAAAVDALAG